MTIAMNPLRVLDRLAREAALERRLEQLVHGGGQRVTRVRRVAEVRRGNFGPMQP